MSTGKSISLDFHGADVVELIEDHKEKLMVGKLVELQSEQQKEDTCLGASHWGRGRQGGD